MKIVSFEMDGEICISPVRDRWYAVSSPVVISLHTKDYGVIRFHVKHGFLFDGRSGGMLADLFVPNLGTQKELASWLVHDINGYDTCYSFKLTNEILRQMLVISGRSKFKSWLVKKAVSLSRTWFGEPNPTDREYINIYPEYSFYIRHDDK